MTALRVINGEPKVIGRAEPKNIHLPMNVGETTYIRDMVEVTPEVDILFITSRRL